MSTIIKTRHFVKEASDCIEKKIKAALEANLFAVVGLAGGTTPIPIYKHVASSDIDWSRVYIVQGDERYIPQSDPDSNWKGANDALISKIVIPPPQIVRIETELLVEAAVTNHEKRLKEIQAILKRDYIFDVLMLGLGADGRTASLFPGSPGLTEREKWVIQNVGPKPYTERITLTYTALNSSKEIIIMVNDKKKLPILEKIWNGEDIPAAGIKPVNGNLTWIVGE